MANVTTFNRDETQKAVNIPKLNDFADPLQKAEKSVVDAYETGQEAVSKWVDEAGPKIKNAYHDAEKGMTRAVESVNSTIKKYPMSAVAIGFGLGCLTAFLVKTSAKRTTH